MHGRSKMKKAWCDECGYTIRLTTKWIKKRVPICPLCQDNMRHELESEQKTDPNQLNLLEGEMEDLKTFQRQKYVDRCSRLRVEKKLKKMTDEEYKKEILRLGKECQVFLLSEPDVLVSMFQEIKNKTGKMLSELGA